MNQFSNGYLAYGANPVSLADPLGLTVNFLKGGNGGSDAPTERERGDAFERGYIGGGGFTDAGGVHYSMNELIAADALVQYYNSIPSYLNESGMNAADFAFGVVKGDYTVHYTPVIIHYINPTTDHGPPTAGGPPGTGAPEKESLITKIDNIFSEGGELPCQSKFDNEDLQNTLLIFAAMITDGISLSESGWELFFSRLSIANKFDDVTGISRMFTHDESILRGIENYKQAVDAVQVIKGSWSIYNGSNLILNVPSTGSDIYFLFNHNH